MRTLARYRYEKRLALDNAKGISRTMPVEPVRAHIRHLLGCGLSYHLIAKSAGATTSQTVRWINLVSATYVNADLGRRILAVRAERIIVDPASMVPPLGTQRRIKALMAIGWTHADMTARCGVSTNQLLNQRQGAVLGRTHLAIAAMFAELCMIPGPSPLTRARAASKGYAPPLAWENIDDPNETPDLGDRRPAGVQVEDVEWLLRTGVHGEALAKRLGVVLDSVETACRRAGRSDLIPALKRGWDNQQEAS